MADWQPIETAPKNGTHFLVACRQEPSGGPFVGHWWVGLARFNINQRTATNPGGAPFLELESREPLRPKPAEITHWHALPEPPEL